MGKRLFVTIVRHGETTLNVQRLLQGHTNTPLSEVGMKQAERLGKQIASGTDAFTKVYSSDLTRAHHTAQIVLQHSGNNHIEIIKDNRLRERCYGCAEGKPAANLHEEAKKLNISIHDYTPEGGEPVLEVMKRAESFFENICQLAEGEKEEHVLIFTHGGWIQYFLKHLYKTEHKYVLENFDPSKAIMIHRNTAVSKFSVNKNDENQKQLNLMFVFVNNTNHLNDIETV